MTIKKWRPFWSYNVEKTEHWLSDMEMDGKQFTDVNLLTRMFSFEEKDKSKIEYQIIYDKSWSPLPRLLEKSGWESRVTEGNWKFIENGEDVVHTYPVREGILKRNKVHANVAKLIAFFSGFQALLMIIILSVILSSGDSFQGEGKLGLVIGFHLLQSLVIITIAIYAARKLRAFERRHFNTGVDETKPTGETFSEWKLSWKEAPDLLESWLSDMAAEGNHFVRIGKQNGRFNFQKGEPKHCSYVYDYQLKATSSYYDVHKSAGWRLKHTSSFSIMKSSIWMKEYEADEEKPRFTYDLVEEKARVWKAITGNALSIFYPVALSVFLLWLLIPFYKEEGLTLFMQLLVGALILSLIIPIKLVIRSVQYALRMRHKLKND